jgi:hypothetical protein
MGTLGGGLSGSSRRSSVGIGSSFIVRRQIRAKFARTKAARQRAWQKSGLPENSICENSSPIDPTGLSDINSRSIAATPEWPEKSALDATCQQPAQSDRFDGASISTLA